MKITVNTIVLFALLIWLLTILLVFKTAQVDVLKEVNIVVSNLVSGWLGYLVKELGD